MKNQKKLLLRNNIILTNKENKDHLINSRQVQFIMGNGKEVLEMGMENRNGLMELLILVNGVKTELMERVDSFMLMEISMMDCGLMIKQMALVFTSMLTEHNMRVNGKMTYNMVKESRLGQMVLDMKGIMHLVENMDQVLISGMTARNTLGNGLKTKYLDLEYIHG